MNIRKDRSEVLPLAVSESEWFGMSWEARQRLFAFVVFGLVALVIGGGIFVCSVYNDPNVMENTALLFRATLHNVSAAFGP